MQKPWTVQDTGDLAYRATFSRKQLDDLNDERISELCGRNSVTVWLGPHRHAVFYPLSKDQLFNLVLIRPDNLPQGVRQMEGDIHEMRASFEGWDEM